MKIIIEYLLTQEDFMASLGEISYVKEEEAKLEEARLARLEASRLEDSKKECQRITSYLKGEVKAARLEASRLDESKKQCELIKRQFHEAMEHNQAVENAKKKEKEL